MTCCSQCMNFTMRWLLASGTTSFFGHLAFFIERHIDCFSYIGLGIFLYCSPGNVLDVPWRCLNQKVILELVFGDLRSFQGDPNSTNVSGNSHTVFSSLVFLDSNLVDLSRSDERVLSEYTMILRLIVPACLYTHVRFQHLSKSESLPSFLRCHRAWSSVQFQVMLFVVGTLSVESEPLPFSAAMHIQPRGFVGGLYDRRSGFTL